VIIPSKPIKLVRFRWNLQDFPTEPPQFPKPYKLREAEKHELSDAMAVVKASYNLDPEWSGYGKHVEDAVLPGLKECFEDEVQCLFVFHGNRVIAASAFTSEPGDNVHLVTGPCVLIEYRNRGIGGALLAATLSALRSRGVREATGQTRPRTPSAKFLFSKFGGVEFAPPGSAAAGQSAQAAA
jgi:GNAT superfamily N-acetyltransferase